MNDHICTAIGIDQIEIAAALACKGAAACVLNPGTDHEIYIYMDSPELTHVMEHISNAFYPGTVDLDIDKLGISTELWHEAIAHLEKYNEAARAQTVQTTVG